VDRLAGKVAVVTGASRGLGLRIAAAFAAEGAEVALLGRSSNDLTTAARDIGERAHPVAADVADPASVAGAFAAIGARYGRVDVLVNNAAVGSPHTLEELTETELLAETTTNFAGPLYCTRAALPLLRAAGGGDVINLSTVAVQNPYPTMWLYSATKAALETASIGLAEELRPDGVRVTVLRVGSVADTAFQDGWSPERKERAEKTARAAGRERFAGEGRVSPDLIAGWAVEIAAMPDNARVGLLEVRPR
jgi:NADP-dependent 3-hydroxy acid dehydrogenase YdfG